MFEKRPTCAKPGQMWDTRGQVGRVALTGAAAGRSVFSIVVLPAVVEALHGDSFHSQPFRQEWGLPNRQRKPRTSINVN